MTESELLRSIQADFRSVTNSVNGLGREISAMSSTLASVSSDVRDHAEKISEIRELELTCPARAREITGVVDTKAARSSTSPKRSQDALGILLRLAPWILVLGVAVGAYLAANGDARASAEAIQTLTASVAQMQNALAPAEDKDL